MTAALDAAEKLILVTTPRIGLRHLPQAKNVSSRQYLGKLYAVELSDELEVDATLSRYEKLEVDWKRARREIVHLPTLRNSYLRCGGLRDDFGNREKVLARLRIVFPTLFQRGG